jgi:hypothetical protein
MKKEQKGKMLQKRNMRSQRVVDLIRLPARCAKRIIKPTKTLFCSLKGKSNVYGAEMDFYANSPHPEKLGIY